VNGAESRRHPVLDLHLVIAKESSKNDICVYKIKAYELDFPLAQPTPKLFGVKLRFPGEQFASFPTTVELQTLPAICLGIENLQIHPFKLPMDQVPKSIKKKFPNSCVLKSELSGKVLLAGNIGESSTISNLISISNLITFRPEKVSKTVAFADPLCTYYVIPAKNKGRRVPTNGWGSFQDLFEPPQTTLFMLACLSEELGSIHPSDLGELEDGLPRGEEGGRLATLPRAGTDRLADTPDLGYSAFRPKDTPDLGYSGTCPDSEPCVLRKIFCSSDSESYKSNEFLYRLYLADLKQFLQPPGKSIDLQAGKVGCSSCDPRRHSVLTSSTVANNSLLLRQLEWEPWGHGRPGGRFVLNRLYRAAMSKYPSCDLSVKADTQNLISKMGNRPNTSRECSYRLQKDFLNDHCVFLTPSEVKQLKVGFITFGEMKIRPVFLPQHCVYNPLSESTPARVVNVPNRKYKQDDGSLATYNDMIRSYSMTMNSIEKLQLRQCLSIEVLGADVSDAFKSCANSYPTSLKCLTYALRQEDGLPTYTQTGNLKLEPLRWKFCTYGVSDLPVIYATALAQSVAVYRKHGEGKFPEWLLAEVEFCLRGLTYCDDLQISSLPATAITFAASKNIFPPEERGPLTVEFCQKYDSFLARASDVYLTEVTRAMVQILSECNFFLKSIDARKPEMRETLNGPEILLKRSSGRLPDIERPPANLVHREAGRRGKSNLHFASEEGSSMAASGGEDSPVYLTQLSRHFHENGRISLKTKHLSLDSTHKNPLEFIYNYQQFLEHLKERKIILNKRHLFSLAGQFYDNLGWTLSGAKTCIKVACHQLHCGPDPPDAGDWDRPVPDKVRGTILLAVQWFYVAVNRSLKRSSLYHYPSTGYYLISESDAGSCCHSTVHFLVSWVRISGIYRAKVQLLTSRPFVNQRHMNSIPLLELLAFLKSCVETIQLLEWLSELGVQVAPCNTLLLSDSQTTLIQARSRASLHTIRVGHMVSKIALQLLHGGLSPFNNCYFFKQEEQIFHSDLLTKLPKTSTLEAIEEAETKLRDYSWMEKEPCSWTHLSRGGIPAGNKELTTDLELNPDYLEEALDLINNFKNSHNSLFSPDQPRPLDSTAHLNVAPTVGPNNHAFTNLLLRKMSKGVVGSGTAVRILARCLYWIKRLYYTTQLESELKKVFRQRRTDLYSRMKDGYSPWCLTVTCYPPLSRGRRKGNCLNPNHYRVSEGQTCPCPALNSEGVSLAPGGEGLPLLPEPEAAATPSAPDPGLGGPRTQVPPGRDQPGNTPQGTDDLPGQYTKLGYSASLNYPTPLLVQQKLELEMYKLVPFAWSHHCEEAFEGATLQYLCCMYASQEAYTGSAKLLITDLGNGHHTHWGMGRVQRDRSEKGPPVNRGRPLLRLIAPQSPLGQAFMVSAHHYSGCHETHGADHQKSLSFLLQKGVFFRHAKRNLEIFSRNCNLCRVQRAVVGKARHRIVRSQSGPSETLSTLSTARAPINSAVCDLAGPWSAQCLGKKCNLKIWYLILVSDLGRVYLYTLQDYSAASTLQCLVTHANKFGSFNFLATDAGSQFTPLATQMSPLPAESRVSGELPKTWARLLDQSPEQQRKLKESNDSSFRMYNQGRHSCLQAAERVVHIIKIYLKKCKLFRRSFQRDQGKLDLLSHQYILSKIELLCNSRPIFIHGDEILTVNDLSIVAQQAGPYLGSSGLSTVLPQRRNQAAAYKARLVKMQVQTNELMESLVHYLSPLLLEVTPTHQKNRDGPQAENLSVGDIVLDQRQLKISGCLTGSLGRIQTLSECSRWAVIVRVKNSFLSEEARRLNRAISRGWRLEQNKLKASLISVGRDTRHLHLVAKAESNTTTRLLSFNGGEKIFQFGLCLEKIRQKEYTAQCLPPTSLKSAQFDNVPPADWVSIDHREQFDEVPLPLPTLSPNSSEEEDSGGEGDEVGGGGGEFFEVTPVSSDPQTEQLGRYTRSGRQTKRPERYGI
jgi:hypothetical protein